MKQSIKSLSFYLFVLCTPYIITADCDDDHRDTFGRTYFHARSDGSNKARDSAGMANLITWGYDNCSNGVVWGTAEYSRSFDQRGLGKYLFFNGSDTMLSGTAAGPGIDIFAENFLLNDNFNSAITARPQVTNKLAEFNIFAALDFCCNGLYVMAHVPYIQTKWNVDFIETASTPGTIIIANTLGNPVDTPAPFNSMIEAWNGQATFFDVKQPLQFARVNGSQKKSRFSDIEIALGYILLDDECNFISINLRGIMPLGNKPQGIFLFEPIVGNDHHYEIGAGILANFYLWEGCCNELLTIMVNANAYTMLKSSQKRTFDLLNNGIGSRYLLFKRFDAGVYADEIVRGPNILTLPIHTSNKIHGDIVLMVECLYNRWIIDGGYNLWGRTRDHINLIGTLPENTFGIAGLSGTAGPGRNSTASATLITGANATLIDAAPVFISNKDINIESAAHPGAFSHGLFAHLGYIWNTHSVQPFIGGGTEIEFSGTNRSLKMWHIWAKIGFSF